MFRFTEERDKHDVGAPLMPLNAFATHRPSSKAYPKQNRNLGLSMASGIQTCYRRVCQFHRWTLGFRQSSFRPIAQALQGSLIHVF